MLNKASRLFLSAVMAFGVICTPVYAEEDAAPTEETTEETAENEEVTETEEVIEEVTETEEEAEEIQEEAEIISEEAEKPEEIQEEEKEEIISESEKYEESEQRANAGSTSGQAYAVLSSTGEMTFFRSTRSYRNGTTGTFIDIAGNQYKGKVYSGVENTYNDTYEIPWDADKESIIKVKVAEGQTIRPRETDFWFSDCDNLTNANLIGFDTSNVADMNSMFSGCVSLRSLNLSNFDTHSVENMNSMFSSCVSLTKLDLSSFNTGNVKNMGSMFFACSRLLNLDLSNFNTSKVTDMSMMFFECRSLGTLDLSSFDTSKVTSMAEMMGSCVTLYKVKLGTKFTKWRDNAYLPEGKWKNQTANVTLTNVQLYKQYSSNLPKYAGEWSRKLTADCLQIDEDEFEFNRKVQKPTVRHYALIPVKEGTDYTVVYSNPKSKYAGVYTVTITGKGKYSGKVQYTYEIVPKEVTPKVTLSASAYTYDGKVKKPSVTVKAGSTPLTTANYTVRYSAGRKDVGVYTVTVKLKGSYTGWKKVSFKINPKGTAVKSLSPVSKGFTVTWNKQAAKMSTSYITGYQIQMATDSKFTQNKKTVTVSGYKNTSKKITGLLAKKKYFVRIRTYKTVSGKKYYSPWSKAKYVTTKG